jgi:hypothetical protein
MNLVFACREDNDLYRALAESGERCPLFASLAEAIAHAPAGAGVLALADGYPRPAEAVSEAQLAAARAKGLRLYLEYPRALPGLDLGEPRPTKWERVIVTGDRLGAELPAGAILALHGCWYLPLPARPALLTLGRVAGYRHLAYGLPAETFPILFEHDADTLVATSKLSQFITGRYAPSAAWRALWQQLLSWLARSEQLPALEWQPTVGLQYGPDAPLPGDAESAAFRRALRWFREQALFNVDHKRGVIEGYEAGIDHLGRQLPRVVIRGDCLGESALVFAADFALSGDPDSRRVAEGILDYVWSAPDFHQSDPRSPAYGLNNWYERAPIFYGDDNARVILPSLAASRLLGETRWHEPILRCALANLRTAGPLGFRRNRIDLAHMLESTRGWRFFRDEQVISIAPHYQAHLWAAYLWVYALSGYREFFQKAESAIRLTMEAYPKWTWTNGMTQELARMLLPLAFLVRIEPTAERRAWLERIAADLLAAQQPSGAIHERLGPPEAGRYPPPRSNETYGTTEASLIQQNGDPACDLLYTANFAFLGLHEAVYGGETRLKGREDRLAELFCRIQVRSTAHPYLDGAWMRSFDDQLWEYYGSSADWGWGAWCVESGWTNAWIAGVLALRQLGQSLFDASPDEGFRALLPRLLNEMELPQSMEKGVNDVSY